MKIFLFAVTILALSNMASAAIGPCYYEYDKYGRPTDCYCPSNRPQNNSYHNGRPSGEDADSTNDARTSVGSGHNGRNCTVKPDDC